MKRLLVIGTILFSGFTAFSQEDAENPYILFCNSNQGDFTTTDFLNCNEVSIRDSEVEVASFVFAIKKKSKFTDIAVTGNKVNDECIEAMKKAKAPLVFRIKNVVDKEDTPVEGYREITLTGEFD